MRSPEIGTFNSAPELDRLPTTDPRDLQGPLEKTEQKMVDAGKTSGFDDIDPTVTPRSHGELIQLGATVRAYAKSDDPWDILDARLKAILEGF